MRTVLHVVVAVVVAAILVFGGLSCAGRRAPRAGLVDGRLRPCPNTPNCVSSEVAQGERAWIAPLGFEGNPEDAWRRVAEAAEAIGGTVQEDTGIYLWATFTSRVFRFVDDVELRLDAENGVIQVRSGSRVGHSDLGVNRKRVERLRGVFDGE